MAATATSILTNPLLLNAFGGQDKTVDVGDMVKNFDFGKVRYTLTLAFHWCAHLRFADESKR